MSAFVVAIIVITVLVLTLNANTCCNSHSLHHDGGEKTASIDEQLMGTMIINDDSQHNKDHDEGDSDSADSCRAANGMYAHPRLVFPAR